MNNTNFYRTINGATGSFILNIIIIVLLIIISTTNSDWQQNSSSNVNSPNNFSEPENTERSFTWVLEKTKFIQVNSDYGSVYYINGDEGLSIENATEPYCVMNENGHTSCAGVSEDATPGLPKSDRNMEFQFSTSNGKKGTLKLVYWKKQYK